MNINRIKNGVIHRAYQVINRSRGWKTDRKIIVIESDDWGSIRMPNKEVYDKSLKWGIRVDKCAYCKYDTLASQDDFNALYNVLIKHKDMNGNRPIITANTIMTNPDFTKIKKDDFQNYHYELFTETLKKYPNCSFNMWQQGIDENIFYPQLHGREHLNFERWLKCLRNNSEELHFAFEHDYFGISRTISNEGLPSFMAALDYDSEISKDLGNKAIAQAADMFSELFGFRSKSFIAPNYFWNNDTEKILVEKNVQYLQGCYAQNLVGSRQKYHYLGEVNKYNQIYLVRNVIFEPASFGKKDWVSTALSDIEKSFKFKKPAVICAHRVNFIGSIFEENRTNNLQLLDKLLHAMLKRWPEIEFMSSSQLGDLIENDYV